jgi:methyltransferase
MTVFHAVLTFLLVQRLAESLLAAANTRRLRLLGAVEVDARFYPLFVLLHAAWLASLALTVPPETPPSWPLLGLFLVLQIGRAWVIATLGHRWTTRIIVLPEAPLVRNGPYRFCRHPNYLIVAAEIAVLPLAFDAIGNAIIFSIINLFLIARRIRIEERALSDGAAAPVTEPSHSGRPATLPTN